MWVRAVAIAVAWVTGCCAVTARAAQYTEVWNPPEARHAPRKSKAPAPAGKKVRMTNCAAANAHKSHKAVVKKASPR